MPTTINLAEKRLLGAERQGTKVTTGKSMLPPSCTTNTGLLRDRGGKEERKCFWVNICPSSMVGFLPSHCRSGEEGMHVHPPLRRLAGKTSCTGVSTLTHPSKGEWSGSLHDRNGQGTGSEDIPHLA